MIATAGAPLRQWGSRTDTCASIPPAPGRCSISPQAFLNKHCIAPPSNDGHISSIPVFLRCREIMFLRACVVVLGRWLPPWSPPVMALNFLDRTDARKYSYPYRIVVASLLSVVPSFDLQVGKECLEVLPLPFLRIGVQLILLHHRIPHFSCSNGAPGIVSKVLLDVNIFDLPLCALVIEIEDGRSRMIDPHQVDIYCADCLVHALLNHCVYILAILVTSCSRTKPRRR